VRKSLPIPGARLFGQGLGPDRPSTRSDENGRFTVECPGRVERFLVTAEGYHPAHVGVPEPSTGSPWKIFLTPRSGAGFALSGVVRDQETGEGIEEATVRMVSRFGNTWTATKAGGRFALPAPEGERRSTLYADHPDYFPAVQHVNPKTVETAFSLLPIRPFTLRFVNPQGAGIPGVRVQIYPHPTPPTRIHKPLITGEEGEVPVPRLPVSGEGRIHILAQSQATAPLCATLPGFRLLEGGCEEFTLRPGLSLAGSVKEWNGTLLEAGFVEAAPILEKWETGTLDFIRSPVRSGAFTLDHLFEGVWVLRVSDPRGVRWMKAVPLSPAPAPLDILLLEPSELEVRLLTPNGEPLTGAAVIMSSHSVPHPTLMNWAETSSGPEGEALFAPVMPGAYRVEVSAPGHVIFRSTVVLGPGESRRVTPSLPPWGSLQGRVDWGSLPIAPSCRVVVEVAPLNPEQATAPKEVLLLQGVDRFHMGCLPPGTAHVRVLLGAHVAGEARSVKIVAGAEVSVTIEASH
jgi:hypothetical protein